MHCPLTIPAICGILKRCGNRLLRFVFHANILDRRLRVCGGSGYGQPRVNCRSATFVALLIALRAQIL